MQSAAAPNADSLMIFLILLFLSMLYTAFTARRLSLTCGYHITYGPFVKEGKSGWGAGAHLRNSPMRIEFRKQPEQLSKTTLSYGHTLNVLILGIVIV